MDGSRYSYDAKLIAFNIHSSSVYLVNEVRIDWL